MKRLSGVIAALTLAGLTLAGAATAARPYIETVTVDPLTFGSCGFPVLFQPAAHDFVHVFTFSNGDVFASGPVLATLTNLDTGKSIPINISGTSLFTTNGDGSSTFTFNGPTLFLRSHVIVDGRTVLRFDADGNLISRTVAGLQTDICPQLAGP
jgi:hypothetical protein